MRDYPPITIGRMVLDRNPENHFAEVEQAGFAPARLVPGIGLSPDKMLMGRIFSYHDTHLHRIGANYEQLPINAPEVPRALLQQGRSDDLPPRRTRSPSTRPTPTAGRRPTRQGAARLVGRGRRDGPLRVRAARRRRRLRPAAGALPRRDGRDRPRAPRGEHRRPRERRRLARRSRSGWSSTGPTWTRSSARGSPPAWVTRYRSGLDARAPFRLAGMPRLRLAGAEDGRWPCRQRGAGTGTSLALCCDQGATLKWNFGI